MTNGCDHEGCIQPAEYVHIMKCCGYIVHYMCKEHSCIHCETI